MYNREKKIRMNEVVTEQFAILSIPSKVYGKNLILGREEISRSKFSEAQGRFRNGKCCFDQIFFTTITTEYSAFMGLEKAYTSIPGGDVRYT